MVRTYEVGTYGTLSVWYEFSLPFGSAKMFQFFLDRNYFARPLVKPRYLCKSLALKVKQTVYPTLLSMWIMAMLSIWA